MFGWVTSLYRYIHDAVYPTPASGMAFGYQWQAGQPAPAAIQSFDVDHAPPAPGIYVVFTAGDLAGFNDLFGRVAAAGVAAPGPVFVAPAAPTAALTTLVATMAGNPPAGEGAYWSTVTPARLRDINGFLSYVATCLNLLDQTGTGHALLTQLAATAYPTFISPASGGNQTFPADNDSAVNVVAHALNQFAHGAPMPAVIDATVKQQYAATAGTLPKYTRLAADMNAMPLYSLFLDRTAFPANFLSTNFRFRGQRFTGQNLMNWLSPGPFGAFDGTVRRLPASVQNVLVREYFLVALGVALYPSTAAGTGTGSGIKFNTRLQGDNNPMTATFRPPAVGLAHELTHALHYARGAATGYPIFDFSTTTAELKFVGNGPYAAEPISENTVRGQWNAVVGADPSNTWAAPVQRTIYEAPTGVNTPATMRTMMHCI